MQNRIDRLENLVTSFVSQTKGAVAGAFTPPSDATLQDITPCTKLVDSAELEPDDFEANQLLDYYRVELTKRSPFVVITPGTTVLSLKRNSPFLYNAIIIATSNDYPSRQALYEEKILEFVTNHLLTRSNKNLELLQGILIFITWYVCSRSSKNIHAEVYHQVQAKIHPPNPPNHPPPTSNRPRF